MQLPGTHKRARIDKAQSSMLAAVAISSVVVIFCLVSAKALLGQAGHQRRVLHERRLAIKQLKDNISSANNLVSQYAIFNGSTTNLIGGKSTADTKVLPPDGNNSRIVLNALPSTYDFPALVSSLSKILSNNGLSSAGISASDASGSSDNSSAAKPQPIPIAVSISGSGNYDTLQKLIKDFERSIRPYDITTLQFQGSVNSMSVSASMNTYYQQAKSLNIGNKEID